jgi:hypothetical protein
MAGCAAQVLSCTRPDHGSRCDDEGRRVARRPSIAIHAERRKRRLWQCMLQQSNGLRPAVGRCGSAVGLRWEQGWLTTRLPDWRCGPTVMCTAVTGGKLLGRTHLGVTDQCRVSDCGRCGLSTGYVPALVLLL